MWLVAIGGMFGAAARFLLGKWVTSKINSSFPFGTWGINISGSFLLGLLAALHVKNMAPDWMWLLLGIGFLGAFTTFSTFAYETIQMLQRKENRPAAIYVVTSVAFSILFVWIGQYIGRIV